MLAWLAVRCLLFVVAGVSKKNKILFWKNFLSLVKDPKSNRATPALAPGSCCRRCCRSDAKIGRLPPSDISRFSEMK